MGTLSCPITFKSVSAPLQCGIRFFRHPIPTRSSMCLATLYLVYPGIVQGCHVLQSGHYQVRCLLSTGRCCDHEVALHWPTSYLRIWFKRVSHFRLSPISIYAQIHMCSPYWLSSIHLDLASRRAFLLRVCPRACALHYVVRLALYS